MTFPTALIATSIPFLASMGFTPGPNNVMVASSGVNFGFRRSLPHLAGITFGYPLMLLLVGLGLAKLFIAVPGVHVVLKYLCIAYLLYLAWRIAISTGPKEGAAAAKPLGFWHAAAFQWINGKGWVIALSSITTYTVVDDTLWLQILALAAISMLVTIGSVSTWTLFGAVLRRHLRSERHLRVFNYAMSALLVASIVPVLFEK
jgi:threonine/homoserine/homoserine lactone efflux protein